MRSQRFAIITFTGILCLLSVLGARAQTTPRGQVVVALSADVPTLDPHMHNVRVMLVVGWHLFESLLTRNSGGMKPTPQLAESWAVIDDVTWEFSLRRGVTFHNGEPFNAATVRYNLERILHPGQKSPQRGNLTWLDRTAIVDEHTIRLVTRTSHPLVPEHLANVQMIPPQYAREVGDQGLSQRPVGTGPYKFVSWSKGRQVVLEANPRYWGEPPAVQTVVFRTIPEISTQIAELLAGNVHLIRTVPPDRVPLIETSGTAYVSKTPILRVVYLSFDCLGRDAASQVALKDRRVRQAIAQAIDVEAIMLHVLGGMALRAVAGVTPMHFGYDGDVQPYAYDPQKARVLLAEAGYRHGLRLTLHTYSGSIINHRQVAEAIMGYLDRVGISLENKHFEDVGTFADYQRSGKLHDMVLGSWGSYSIFDADMLLHPLFHRSEPFTYCTDARLEATLERERSSLEPLQRLQLMSQAQRMIMQHAYWVPLYGQYEILAVNNQLKYQASTDEIIRVFNATWRD